MSSFSVGKDILSYCSKCKLTLSHLVVMLKEDETPGKVMCNTCKSTHSYKNPAVAKQQKKKQGTAKITKAQKLKQMNANYWQETVESYDGEMLKYSPKTCFKIGDIINHPSFGKGIIDRTMDGNKIEVIFQVDVKTLVHNR